ncbi:hypothetical protein LUW74_20880 [Actinomadura madurae]|uniref:hypothetical protein n=1 Tax=Actinomadura madurae TaxID=1993 RepID=UPI0020264A6F|nr:hypothetical protein [Actinomadura madurae]URN05525.1 hypothetical protein LUW74_20880 [Actinomadura madurae]
MIRTLKGRGLVLLAAAPLLGGVAAAPGAHADVPVPAVHERGQDAASKPPPRQKAHGKHKSKKHKSKKHSSKKHCHEHGKKHGGKHASKHGGKHKKHSLHGGQAAKHKAHASKHQAHGRVVLHTDGPERAVVPGRTYEWSFEVLAKGSQKSARAVFLVTLPRSLVFVSGGRCKATGRTVVCNLGTLKQGRWADGEFKAKVSERARSGQRIALRGTVMWGSAVDAGGFPAVRVAKAAGHGHAKPAKNKPSGHGHARPSGQGHAKTPPERARIAGTP